MTDTLTDLAIRAGRGDRDALARFVRDSQATVWRFCAALGEIDSADDLTQETYVRALRSLDSFEGRSSAQTWLLAVARNVVADSVRTAQRLRRLDQRVQHHSSSDALTERSRTGRIELDQLIDELPPDRREAFVLTQVVGLDYREAAEVMGCPIGTIRSRVARARRDLIDAVTILEGEGTG